jgi:thioredoxin 2
VANATIPCSGCGKLNRVELGRAGAKCGACELPLASDRPMKLTDGTLARVVADSPVPVLVDFYADWCGPCKIMAPVIDALAKDRAGGALVGKLDTDRNPATAARFGIASIPTLILFRNGREAARELGAVPRARLEAMLG